MTGSVKAGLSSFQSLLAASSHRHRRDSVAPEGNTEMCAWNHPRARARQKERERERPAAHTPTFDTRISLAQARTQARVLGERRAREGGKGDTCQIGSSRGMYWIPLRTHRLSRTDGCAALTGRDTGPKPDWDS